MIKWLLPVLLLLPSIAVTYTPQKITREKAKRALDAGYEKNAISDYQTLIKESVPEKKGELLKELAIAYLKDQDQDKAFTTYLDALDNSQSQKEPYLPTDTEKKVYDDALKIYLDPKERDTHEISLRLIDLYAGVLRLHQDFYSLGFLIAIAYANLDHYEKFFNIFYPSYQKIPDHYLSYKTKAILYIKVFERAKTPEEKQAARDQILKNLELAKGKFPKDPALYKLQIVFSPNEKKLETLKRNLNEIIIDNMIVGRADLAFYYDQLFTYGQIDLAKEFLKKASEWYPYSRTLEAAKELIDEKELDKKEQPRDREKIT